MAECIGSAELPRRLWLAGGESKWRESESSLSNVRVFLFCFASGFWAGGLFSLVPVSVYFVDR